MRQGSCKAPLVEHMAFNFDEIFAKDQDGKSGNTQSTIDYIFEKAREGVDIYNDVMKDKRGDTPTPDKVDHPVPPPTKATGDDKPRMMAGFNGSTVGKLVVVGLAIGLIWSFTRG